MYLEFYNLKEKPFNLTPDPAFIYYSQAHKRAIAFLKYGLQESKGFLQLTGPVGSGKTTLLRAILSTFDERTKTAYIINPSAPFPDLLRSIMKDLEIPNIPQTRIKTELLDFFHDYLFMQVRRSNRVVVIFDEAQNLSPNNLEEIRMLSNFETTKEKLIQIVFVGQPELIEVLNRHELRQLKQRIQVRYHLSPLEPEEVKSFINHRLHVAGSNGALTFTNEACEAIYCFSGGIPRLINSLCDVALLIGYVNEKKTFDLPVIEEAIKEISGTFTDEPLQRESAHENAHPESHEARTDKENLPSTSFADSISVTEDTEPKPGPQSARPETLPARPEAAHRACDEILSVGCAAIDVISTRPSVQPPPDLREDPRPQGRELGSSCPTSEVCSPEPNGKEGEEQKKFLSKVALIFGKVSGFRRRAAMRSAREQDQGAFLSPLLNHFMPLLLQSGNILKPNLLRFRRKPDLPAGFINPKVMVLFKENRLAKGIAKSLDLTSAGFSFFEAGNHNGKKAVFVEFETVIAICLINSLNERWKISGGGRRHDPKGRQIIVTLMNGEVVEGVTLDSFEPSWSRFFVVSPNIDGNPSWILIERSGSAGILTESFREGIYAEEFASLENLNGAGESNGEPGLHESKGDFFFKVNDFESALREYQKATETELSGRAQGKLSACRLNLGIKCLKENRPDECRMRLQDITTGNAPEVVLSRVKKIKSVLEAIGAFNANPNT
jgi:general secretion pathway protein A